METETIPATEESAELPENPPPIDQGIRVDMLAELTPRILGEYHVVAPNAKY